MPTVLLYLFTITTIIIIFYVISSSLFFTFDLTNITKQLGTILVLNLFSTITHRGYFLYLLFDYSASKYVLEVVVRPVTSQVYQPRKTCTCERRTSQANQLLHWVSFVLAYFLVWSKTITSWGNYTAFYITKEAIF